MWLVALGLAAIAVLVLDAGSSPPEATADEQRRWQPGSVTTVVTDQRGNESNP